MKYFYSQSRRFLHMKNLLCGIFSLLLIGCLFLFSACKKSTDYFAYVSELRSNIFLAETEEFSLRVYALERESPYLSDGIKREMITRTEFHLSAKDNAKSYTLSFEIDGVEYGGEFSFDNVKTEFYYACNVDISALSSFDCQIIYEEKQCALCPTSIRLQNTLSPKALLQQLVQTEQEFFSSLTDKYGFAGEIYMRLIYENTPYYYVGVIDRQGNVCAFLLNAQTGKILAKRQS